MTWLPGLRAEALVAAIGLFAAGSVERGPVAPVIADSALRHGNPEFTVELLPDAIGRSGALRTRMVMPGQMLALPLAWSPARPADAQYQWASLTGLNHSAPRAVPASGAALLEAPLQAGVYELQVTSQGVVETVADFRLVVKVPLPEKASRLNGYNIGQYPAHLRNRTDRYRTPDGLIEVDRKNQDLQLSEHFKLSEFLTHDQVNVWPKYAVVEPRLLDKLELVLAELEARGIPAKRMVVMSGYRTPQYNQQGLDQGRAALSRHQYGDAADVWVDNDGDWYMDDLNGDGRRDTSDARVILQAVERVEARHPELIGGAGVYKDNGAHGPFIHIDTRGTRARW